MGWEDFCLIQGDLFMKVNSKIIDKMDMEDIYIVMADIIQE